MYKYENARKKHIEIYGSFLHCPQTGHLCCFMEEQWKTGCECIRTPCILEDPEDIALKERQAQVRKKRELEEEKKTGCRDRGRKRADPHTDEDKT